MNDPHETDVSAGGETRERVHGPGRLAAALLAAVFGCVLALYLASLSW